MLCVQLSGTIPLTLTALTALTRVDLDQNSLSGTIPAAITALSKLKCVRVCAACYDIGAL